MTDSRAYKLSLVAQYDDLLRGLNVLLGGTDLEKFCEFVKKQDAWRESIAKNLEEARGIKRALADRDNEIGALEKKLKHARHQISKEMDEKAKLRRERDDLVSQKGEMIQLLTQQTINEKDRQSFINSYAQSLHTDPTSPRPGQNANLSIISETLSISDIDYDKTEEDLSHNRSYLRSGKEYKGPSAPPLPVDDAQVSERRRRSKRHRRSRSANQIITTTRVAVDQLGVIQAEASITTDDKHNVIQHTSSTPATAVGRDGSRKKLRKSKSEATLKPNREMDAHSPYTPPQESPRLRHYNSGSRSLNRPHTFIKKAYITETCYKCGNRLPFRQSGFKCKDCKVYVCAKCKDRFHMPCYPSIATPAGANKQNTLSDFTPLDPPHVPALIVHCVGEIENRGLEEVGLYRISGEQKQVKDLKEKFTRGKGIPNLATYNDIHVLCGCIKLFLKELKESIITYNLWQEFVGAAETTDVEDRDTKLLQCVMMLPPVNRDTLAFLLLHFKRVFEAKEYNKMSENNLARCLGPTVVGYSSASVGDMQAMSEMQKQQKVMEALLNIDAGFLERFTNPDGDVDMVYGTSTPDMKPGMHTTLGLLGTPDTGDHPTSKKSFFGTPKYGSKSGRHQKHPARFFASPILK